MADIFKLSGSVDVDTGAAERGLKRVDSDAKKTAADLGRLSGAGRNAGSGIAAGFDRATASAGRLKSAASSLSSALGKIRGGGGMNEAFGSLTSIAGGNLLSGALSSALGGVSSALKSGFSAGVEYNKMLEKASISFETLLGSAASAQKHLKDLQAFGEATPFEFPDLIKASQRMQAMGFAARDVIPSLRSIGDSIGAVGGGKDELDGVVMALGQMQTKGKVSAEEMNQLAERGLPAWDLLAKAIGRSKEETIKLSEAGKLNGGRAVQGIVAMMGERFGGQMSKLSQTLEGRESNFQDILNRQLGTATSGAFEQLKAGYQKAAEGLGTAGAQAFAGEINKLLTDIGKQMDPILQDIASGKAFQQGAQATQMLGDAGAAAGKTAGFLKKIAPKDSPLNQQYEIKDLNIFRPEGMKDPLDRAVFGGIKSALQALGIIGAEEGQKAGQAIGAGIEQGAKDALQIKSPSKVFEAIGLNAIAGLWNGLEAGKKSIRKSPIDVEAMKKKTLDELKTLRDDPRIKAMLDTIAEAEGANYNTLFGGGRFSDFGQHPNQRITRKLGGKNITSTAAGRYQFLNGTWAGLQKQLGLSDFSPESQDLGAIQLMKGRGMIAPIMSGDLSTALTKGNREWASLPGSPYGQPTKKSETLIDKYAASLEKLTGVTLAAIQPLQAFVEGLGRAAELPQAIMGKLSVTAEAGKAALGLSPGNAAAAMAALPPAMKKLEVGLSAMPAPFSRASESTAAAASQAGKFADAIMGLSESTGEAIDHFASMRESISRGFDDLIDEWIEGGRDWIQTGKRVLADFFKSTISSLISSASGGRASSPGQLLGNLLGGSFGRQAGASAGGSSGGIGDFLTGGFSGGNPARDILTGGGSGSSGGGLLKNVGGLFRKIPGLGGLFSKGAGASPAVLQNGALQTVSGAAAGLPTSLDPTTTLGKAAGAGSLKSAGAFGSLASGGLLLGGGLAGSFAGKGTIGKLMGQAGGTLLAGFAGASGLFGGGVSAALPALFSNPFTAIIGAGLIGGALLTRLFGNKDLKSLKGLIRGEYGIEVKADKVLQNVKALGESKFGKDFKRRQIETVRLPETKELLSEYAARTGQKGNSKLVSPTALGDEFSAANQFAIAGRREAGGPVAAGLAYLVGEKRPEVFVPSMPGKIVPSVGAFAQSQGAGLAAGPGAGELREAAMMLAAATEALNESVSHLRSMSPDDVITKASPSAVTRQVERSFSRRDESANAIRTHIERR